MRRKLTDVIRGQVLNLSFNMYGCRVVQKALDVVDEDAKMDIAEEMRGSVLQCIHDQNANHVISKVVETIVPRSKVAFIPETFYGKAVQLSSQKHGCRVIQRVLDCCEPSQTLPLLDELKQGLEILAFDSYGNYVIQWIIERGSETDKSLVIDVFRRDFLCYASHKCASHVAEKVVGNADSEVRSAMIESLFNIGTCAHEDEADATPIAVQMMKDEYANYVLQLMIDLAEPEQKARLVALLRPALLDIKRTQGLSKVLQNVETLLDSSVQRVSASTMTAPA